jgi:hypothetical protein
MGSQFPALDIPTPESPLTAMAKAMQIKGMMQGQQMNAAQLQGQQISNQERQQQLEGMKAVSKAQQDPSWNPNDPDTVVNLLNKYRVPLPIMSTVVKGITEQKNLLASSSAQNLQQAADMHSFMDDQFQAVKSAAPERQQSVYQQAIQTLQSHAAMLPDGPAKQLAMREISNIPPVYDPQYVNEQHAIARSQQYLTEEALKNAQAREANQKGNLAMNEGNLAAAKIPGAQAESTIQGQEAAQTPGQRAMKSNLFYGAAGGDATAQKALNLETQQKVAAAQAGVAGAPSALRGVAPHLIPAATAAFDKAGQEYATAYQSAQNMSDFLQQARSGNKEAVKIVPLQGALEITTAQGVHRINRTEVDQFAGAGSAYDKLAGMVGGALTGKNITNAVLNDMDALQKTVSRNAKSLHANKVSVINQSYGSSFQPMDFSKTGGSGTIKMLAPNGQTKDVSPDEVEHYKSRGAKVVQ